MPPATFQRAGAPEQIAGTIAVAIVTGELQPGDRLPPQRALAARHGVNMATAREAVKHLEALNLVVTRHGDGMRVADWRREGGLDVLLHVSAPELVVAALPSVLEARRLLLVEAASLAARRSADARLPAFGGDQESDLAFMEAVIAAAGNVVFRLIMNTIRRLYRAHFARFAPMVSPDDAPLYERIARAIADGDEDGAARGMRELCAAQEGRLL